jgi:hypothetical protein
MYKTISIQNNTYQNLNAIASKLDKPKAQIIDGLIRAYIDNMKEQENKELQSFNTCVSKLADRIKLPKGAKIKSEDMDKDFALLKDLTI